MELGQRKRRILKAIIEDYINTAEPVGSNALRQRTGLEFSSATIRNEMADLEQMGYLEQPHTSAGRVPSPAGYRLYVNELMNRHRLTADEMDAIDSVLSVKMQELDRLLTEVGRLVADLTSYTAYSTSPSADKVRFRVFEFIAIEATSFIAVIVTDADIVKNKLIKTVFEINVLMLRDLANIFNSKFTGITADEMTADTVYGAAEGMNIRPELIDMILRFIEEVVGELEEREVYLTGSFHLLSHPEYKDIMKAKKLLEYLSDKREMSRLPVPNRGAPVNILIGPENVAEQLRESSVVVASYHIGDNMRGIIGVVGPTRMDYSKVATRLAYFSRRLNRMLNEEFSEDK